MVVHVANGTAPGSHLSTVTADGFHVEFILPHGHKEGTPLVVQYEEPAKPSLWDSSSSSAAKRPPAPDDDVGLIQGHDGRDASIFDQLIDADHDGRPDAERNSTLLLVFRAPTAEPTGAPTLPRRPSSCRCTTGSRRCAPGTLTSRSTC